jgi:hypothetical protein
MANVFRLGGVDCVFGDALGVVTDPPEVPRNRKVN